MTLKDGDTADESDGAVPVLQITDVTKQSRIVSIHCAASHSRSALIARVIGRESA
jgi:hypothetical protein